MKRLKRTSRFDVTLNSYLDEENQAYVYEYIGLDEKGREVPMKQIIAITEENIEIIKILDEYDHYETLQNRYKKENEDVLIHKNITCNENGEEYRESLFDKIPDKKAGIYNILFGEVSDNSKYDKFMATLNENQRNLIYEHINLGKSLPQISRDNGNISIKALESRWAKIRKKAIRFFDIK